MKYGTLTLGQIEAHINKIGGAQVLIDHLSGKVEISVIQKEVAKYLRRLGEVVLPASKFSLSKKYWTEMSGSFRENILSVEQLDSVPETVASHRLVRDINDVEIQGEMPEGHAFGIHTSCALLFGMIDHDYLLSYSSSLL